MKYITKKTNEFTPKEKENYCRLFKSVFNRDFTLEDFDNKYKSTVYGYSYHGLMIEDDEIVGSNSIVPFYYHFFGRKIIFGLDMDTMIEKAHRHKDIMALKKIWQSSIPVMKAEQIPIVFGIPNAIAYPYWIKVNKWKDIGGLHYYILPIRISKLAHLPGIFDIYSLFYSAFFNFLAAIFPGSKKERRFPIARVDDPAFAAYRFQGYFKNYRKIDLGSNGIAYYTIVAEEKARVAYIIDVQPFSAYHLSRAVREVYRLEKKTVDAILYVDRLDFCPVNLFKAPRRFEPVPIRLCFQVVDDSIIDGRADRIENWHTNLATFDVR